MNKIKASSINQITDQYISGLKSCLDQLDRQSLETIIELIMDTYHERKTVFIMGNGGSASTASHMSCDFNKGTLLRHYDEKEKRFRVISLTDNVALLTAYGNDLSYEDIFVQQLRNLVERGDVVIAISGSGNSANCVKAVQYAKRCGAQTIGLLGFKTGGKLAKLVDLSIIIKSNHYGICEDMHLILDHIITTCITKIKPEHDRNHELEHTLSSRT